jgi:methenyltetrahydrofolate cyclohydrolase
MVFAETGEEGGRMPSPMSESTLEHFRSAAASGEPVPAGVAVSAVGASFALGLLSKVLTISRRRKDFTGNSAELEALADAARASSKRMMQFAEEDMAAFNAYMASARLPQATDGERAERKRAVDVALRKAIEVPLASARAAASGIGLCLDATGMVHAFVAPDLGAAVSLLAGALRVFLLCADSNIRQIASDAAAYRDAGAGRPEWEAMAFRQTDSVLKQVASAIDAAASRKEGKS